MSRLNTVESYRHLKQWEERPIFRKIIARIRKDFNLKGVSISLVTNNKVVIQYESMLNMAETSRAISIDGHALLSQDYFLLLDAKNDWRTAVNPFVTSMPYIQFYCGVPLETPKHDVIGILSIFESYPRKQFEPLEIKKLREYSKEIMDILSTPLDQLRIKYNSNGPNSIKNSNNEKMLELNQLKLRLGRATSRGSSMTVFEKDGSGGPYTQTYNFKMLSNIINETEKQELMNNRTLTEKLLRIGSLKKGANLLSKIISTNYNIDFVYILEIRIAETYKIDSQYFAANDNKVEADTFKYANKLIKDEKHDPDFMTRIIGSYGSTHSSLNFENLIHHKSFQTEFGIHYKNLANNTIYNNGVIMPFYRHNSKLVRQKRAKPGSGSSQGSKSFVNLYLRSGGFLIGLFNKDMDKHLEAEDLSKIFTNVSIMRKIYISG